ncbi:CMP-sialic acid transporter 4-like [Cryptomeria japonica]|uniref:CMP-sialic acid transporter 4-like n=1 Tax=Cryptomeria japonica TaxID=3369 RepID=UPI0025AD6686|nr:CMP-sialic acid transporter 4-like [Cryptomeria japonica]
MFRSLVIIAWSKRAGKYDYSVATANFMMETLKCVFSLVAVTLIWEREGITEDNKLITSWEEIKVYPVPAGLYLVKNLLQLIIKKRPSRNINAQNFWLYIFGMIFSAGAMFAQDDEEIRNKGFFHGFSLITVCMIINHALGGIAVSMVMKYADNIVKVYSTSVAMLLTAIISIFLFGFHLTLPFVLGSMVLSVSVYLHSKGA